MRVAKPDGLLVVPLARELEFLHPLPVERVWGVGPVTAAKLHARGIATVGELARVAEPILSAYARSCGGAPPARTRQQHRRPARARRAAVVARSGRSVRSGGGAARPEELDTDLVALVDRVTRRLRASRRVGRTVVLRLRFADFSRASRSHTLRYSTAETEVVLAVARTLFAAARPTVEQRGPDADRRRDRQPR